METQGVWGVTNAELESAVAAVDSTALMVPARLVRRALRHDRGLTESGHKLPHRKTYFISRDSLLTVVDLSELGRESAEQLPETVILLARPEPEQLSSITRPRALLKYWRLLFHARVHVECEKLIAAERLNTLNVQERIARIGRIEFDEVRAVLKQENLLLPPVDDLSTYVEFLAVYLELKYFAPRLLSDYFPSIRDWKAIEALVAADFDGPHWLAATKLPGSPEANEHTVEDEETLMERRADPSATNPRKQSDRLYCRLMNMADAAQARGNDVRSSILRWWAALRIGPKLARTAREAGRKDLRHLARRLVLAADAPEADHATYGDLLEEMLSVAARGIWTPEARFLYDLQKICLDYEQGVYQLDVMGWLAKLGKRPIKRQLPHQREVLQTKHLRRALQRLPSLRISAVSRDRLSHLLHGLVHRAEHQLREALRPRFEAALDEVGLKAANRPEVTARKKLIEELLDRVVERGFVNMGDLRDAVSRNNLKLRDIVEWRELWTGDEALRADRALGKQLEGVYRRGEVYRRIPQWLSSAAFGTMVGRMLTKYAAIPFGGAFVVLAFFQHMLHKPLEWAGAGEIELRTSMSVALLGSFIIMLYSPAFRSGCWEVVRSVGRLFANVFVTWPKMLLDTELVRRFRTTAAYRALQQFLFKPLVSMLVLAVLLSLLQFRPIGWKEWTGVFIFANLLVNSKWGRRVDEWLGDLGQRYWHRLRIKVFTTLVHAVVDFFNEALEAMERVLYAVDEWLRFRSGESRFSTMIKASLGFVWYFVNYVVRFCVTLLIEPQVNPVKHFPVVTVSHKIILPLGPMFVGMLDDHIGFTAANSIVWSTIWLIPGVFGFLVWELKENWRLYEANRSPNLKPVMVGHHGESIVGLLRPAFHSGTVPKTYGRLRRADRKALAIGEWGGSRKYRHRLDEVRESVARFTQRELVETLSQSIHCRSLRLQLSDVTMGINHLRITLAGADDYAEPLCITLVEKAYWLTSRTSLPAWYERLSIEQTRSLTMALLGFFKMCGVELVHEQIEKCFAPDNPRYDFQERGLVVWPDAAGEESVLYDLRRTGEHSQLVSPTVPCALPTLDRQRLVFASAPFRWAQWVDIWESEARRMQEELSLHVQQPWQTTLGSPHSLS